ncbi:MAG: DnaJ domain-containing protein, partial [Allosphingosinicella sp.]
MAGPRSLYDVLNVAPEAEPVVVEAAYKALIKKYHPDQAVEARSRDATAINEAFAVLKDPAKRADYDHRLWTKQQAIRLAEAQVASAGRPPRFVAVSGWLIAGLLA